jgi:uncharacterized protein
MRHEPLSMERAMTSSSVTAVRLDGLLGDALKANLEGRLARFITSESSPAIALFSAEHQCCNVEGDWYGEHAGKWLYAAAKAFARTHDATLLANLGRVADYLVARQDDDGYLGTYAPERRFMRRQPPKPGTWDGAPSVRTWDMWTHSYLVLGLLEVHRHVPTQRYLDAARRIGDLCWRTLTDGGIDICELGNHHGMSATVLTDAAAELYFATGEQRYLDLATLVLQQADRNPDLALLKKALAGADAADIATGKAYQLLWNLVGLAKLHRATGGIEYRRAVERLWHSVRDHHRTLGGGPWGGVAQRSREVFNAAGVFSPQGYVETCSTLAWIQLNRELFAISGEAKYIDEIERSAYNDLLGAQSPDGEDWCYYSFANGRRVHTTYWRCCKSSGAMALEELPALAYGIDADDIVSVNLYGPSAATLKLAQAGEVKLEQITAYPFAGAITLRVTPERAARFALRLRIPAWADGATLQVNAGNVESATPGTYARIEREWQANDTIALDLPMPPRLHRAFNRSTQESRAPDGTAIRQDVLRYAFAAITRGPLVYATELIDGFKTEETIRLPTSPSQDWLRLVPAAAGVGIPAIELDPGYRAPLVFRPYYCTGGRKDGAWRLTWMSLAPDDAAAPD